jgi:glycerol-3-phosphate dehydrogenase
LSPGAHHVTTPAVRDEGPFDLAIIGGGVNGCGIARDAAGRGLSVFLCEQGDLAQGTSSASTKLIHGGLRYLEYGEVRLVRESLIEREVLLRAMPHIAWPLRFVLPHRRDMRPAWKLRLGLLAYDSLGGRRILPGTRTLNLRRDPAGRPLRADLRKAFEYSDCWVQDSRLVVLNARDAAARGAEIAVRTRCTGLTREGDMWRVRVEGAGGRREIRARALVNAAGPWVAEVVRNLLGREAPAPIRLVRGSHIVVRRLWEHDRAYVLQQPDERIVFAIPYEDDFTLIGTTDRDHTGDPGDVRCSDDEAEYLCRAVSDWLARPVGKPDIVWRFAGVRPLYDDGAKEAKAATRDYVLDVDDEGGPPVLNVYGGKITTYRRLAEAALKRLKPWFPQMGRPWTRGAALPGGDFPVDGVAALIGGLMAGHPYLDAAWARRLVRTYGTEAAQVLGDARSVAALGRRFGASLTEAEVRWLVEKEWARTASDVLWRRTRLGLHLTPEEAAGLDDWMRARAETAGGVG